MIRQLFIGYIDYRLLKIIDIETSYLEYGESMNLLIPTTLRQTRASCRWWYSVLSVWKNWDTNDLINQTKKPSNEFNRKNLMIDERDATYESDSLNRVKYLLSQVGFYQLWSIFIIRQYPSVLSYFLNICINNGLFIMNWRGMCV